MPITASFARDVLPIRDSLIAIAELALADMLDRARLFEEAYAAARTPDLEHRRRSGFDRIVGRRAGQLGDALMDLERALSSLEDAGEFDASADFLRRKTEGIRALEPCKGA